MKKMKKIGLIALSTMALLISGGALVGCETKLPETENVLTFEVAEQVTVPYAEYYTLPSVIGKDTNGNLYFPKTKVTDGTGAEVIVERGRFYVLSDADYTFEYTLKFNGETHVKKTTAKVADMTAPKVELSVENIGGFVNERFEIPTITYTDNKDAAEEMTNTVKVLLGEQEIPLENNGFTPTTSGSYKITYAVSDKSNNVTEKTITAEVLEREAGNISYWNNIYWQELSGGTLSSQSSVTISRGTGEYASPAGGSSLGLNISNAYFIWGGTLSMTTPAITDISGYKYVYLWVYTTHEGGVRLTYNNYWYGAITNISEGQWTRVVFERGEDGNFYSVGNDRKNAYSKNELFCINNPADENANKAVIPTNISGFTLNFQSIQTPKSGNTQVYLGGLYACNELPALPENTTDWRPAPVISVTGVKGAALPNTQVKVGYTTDTEGLTYKTYVQIGDEKTPLENATYTYPATGTYKFIVEAEKNGKIVATASKEVIVVEKDEGNIAYWNDENWAELSGGTVENKTTSQNPWLAIERGTGEFASPAGGSSLGIYSENWQTYWGADLAISDAAISNVSGYKYVYAWVYTTDESGVRLTFNSIYNTAFEVEKGKWTRIVFVKGADGNFYAKTSKAESSGLFNDKVTASNLNGFSINIQKNGVSYPTTDGVIKWTYFGGLYACNELPELPENTVDWWTVPATDTPSEPTPDEPTPDEPTENPSTAIPVVGEAILWREEWNA